MRSIYDRTVGGVKDRAEYEAHDASLDKPFTPADAFTVARPLLAAKAGRMLLRGQKGVTKVVAAMAATDGADGKSARLIDRLAPDTGWGSTAHGAPWDTYADTGAILIVGGASLLAPRVTRGAKAAIGITLGQETTKAVWAIRSNKAFLGAVDLHRDAINTSLAEDPEDEALIAELSLLPTKLKLPSSAKGKAAMADKLTGLTLGVATNDFDNPVTRSGLTAGALYFSGVGAWNGEAARQAYKPDVRELIEEHRAAALAITNQF